MQVVPSRLLRRWCLGHRALALLISLQAVLLAFSAWTHSPNFNEPAHLVAGLSHWRSGDFSLYRVNPPLVRLIASLPVAMVGYEADWSRSTEMIGARPEFAMGEDWIRANGFDSIRLIRMARLTAIPLVLLGTGVCFVWAQDLMRDVCRTRLSEPQDNSPWQDCAALGGADQVAGWMAATLWVFSPMILGHGAMITPDAHASALGLAACYTFWRWLKRPT